VFSLCTPCSLCETALVFGKTCQNKVWRSQALIGDTRVLSVYSVFSVRNDFGFWKDVPN